jgi:hypothetical protein
MSHNAQLVNAKIFNTVKVFPQEFRHKVLLKGPDEKTSK